MSHPPEKLTIPTATLAAMQTNFFRLEMVIAAANTPEAFDGLRGSAQDSLKQLRKLFAFVGEQRR